MDLEEELRRLSADDLAPRVRTLLRDAQAEPLTWHVERVDWAAVNPATVGIFRVRGAAETSVGQQQFSLVFKAVADVRVPGLPDEGYMREPKDWNYWKREPLAFASGLLDDCPGPLVPVRCVGTEDRGDVAFLWLEELHEAEVGGTWSQQRHVLAARHLARFNAEHTRALPSTTTHPWLCQRFTTGWLATLTEGGAAAACESDELWRHPALCDVFPQSLGPRVADLLADAEDLLAVGDSLPLTLTHHDAHRGNLFHQHDRGLTTTRILDWGFLGLAPVGEDLGHQVGVNIFDQHISAADASTYELAAADAYLAGLRQAGVDLEPARVRTHARAVAALQLVSFAAGHVAWLAESDPADENAETADLWPTAWATQRGIEPEQLMRAWAATLHWLLALGETARRDAEAL